MIPPYHSESHTLRFNWNKEASLSIWDNHLLCASSHASFHRKNFVSTSCLSHLLHFCTNIQCSDLRRGWFDSLRICRTVLALVRNVYGGSRSLLSKYNQGHLITTAWRVVSTSRLQVEETQMIYSRCQCITPVSRLLCPLRMMRGTKVTICLGRCAWRGHTWRLDDNSRSS